MTTEKRGSEKLLDSDNGLCSLSTEELSQVAGGAQSMYPLQIDLSFPIPRFPDVFPLGQFPPYLFNDLTNLGDLGQNVVKNR